MKKIFLSWVIIFLINAAKAQSGFVANSYYQYHYQISDVAIGYPYQKTDYYGRYAGTYQMYQRAVWHQESGGTYVNVWNGWQWATQWIDGSYWWFEWVDYEKFLGY